MYDNFTERASRVMHLANQESMRQNRAATDTPELLIALIREGSGVAANALKGFTDLTDLRNKMAEVLPPGPDMIIMGRLPLTRSCKYAIECARQEAKKLGDNHVGTEHLLLGLMSKNQDLLGPLPNHALEILALLEITPEQIRGEVMRLLGNDDNSQVKYMRVCLSPEATANIEKLQERLGLATPEETVEAAIAHDLEWNDMWAELSDELKEDIEKIRQRRPQLGS